MQSYYKLLNISPTANEADLKKAIHETSRLWSNRTDAPQENRRQEAERMVRIFKEAEVILLNPLKRAEYDKQLKNTPSQKVYTDEAALDATQDLVAEGRKLLADGNTGDALYVATKATERDGGNSEAWALLGRARFLFGDVDDAIYEFKRAIKLKPNEGRYYSELGDIYDSMGKLDDALTQYRKAAQVESSNPWYRADVGRILVKQSKGEEAVDIFEQCVKEEPDSKQLRSLLVAAYLDSAKKCCSLDPESGSHHPASKAEVLAVLGFIHKAEKVNGDAPDAKESIENNKQALRDSIQRQYDGCTGAAVVGGILWTACMGLGLVLFPYYLYASRPPRYALFKRHLSQESTGTQKAMQTVGKVADLVGANDGARAGIGLAVIIGTSLFLPIMAVVNYRKNYTGENDIKDIKI